MENEIPKFRKLTDKEAEDYEKLLADEFDKMCQDMYSAIDPYLISGAICFRGSYIIYLN